MKSEYFSPKIDVVKIDVHLPVCTSFINADDNKTDFGGSDIPDIENGNELD